MNERVNSFSIVSTIIISDDDDMELKRTSIGKSIPSGMLIRLLIPLILWLTLTNTALVTVLFMWFIKIMF